MARALEAAPSGIWRLPDVLWPRRVALVSDFLDDDAVLARRAAEHIVAGGEVFAIHVVAREELDPDGTILAVDPEHDDVRRALGPETRDAYRRTFDAWRASVAARWRGMGAVYHETVTADDPGTVIRRIVRRP
ncbi:MAG: hypothetical protein WEC54_06600 [Gemmatimonadales bacterium]